MAVEAGAKAGLFETDDTTKKYLEERGHGNKFKQISADDDAVYERVINIDASKIEPTVSCPHTVDNTKLAKDLSDIKVNQVMIGTCTNGRIEDFRIAAKILDGKKINKDTRLLIVPSSREVLLKLIEENLLEIFNLCQIYGEESLPADLTNDKKTLQQLSNILKQFLPSCFINIVEEPEQNLFPTTQAQVLYELLKYKNENENNKLIITTHSPYILTSLNNAIFAKDVFNKQHKYIEELPENKMVSFEDISAYKLEEGNIISIRDEETRLINAYQIDDCSIQIDENFSKLSELMEQNND